MIQDVLLTSQKFSRSKKKSKGGTTLEKVNHIFVLILLFVFFVAFGIIIYYKRLSEKVT